MDEKWTLARIGAEVMRLDPNVEPDSDTFKTAVLLLCSLIVGPGRAAAYSGYPASFTAPRVQRLRANGIWQRVKRRERICSNWFDKHGAMAFWLDVCVAEGLMERADGSAQGKAAVAVDPHVGDTTG